MGIVLKNVNITGGKLNSVLSSPNPPSVTLPTATLMKTGQTTSYRTGDDGDIEAGRATSFTVLASNNPFGNTNRFTDTAGGQTYTNRIRIDWSTYDGTTVLGYYQLATPLSYTWNQAIDWALALSISTFTSGWRLPNINELMNLMNWGIAQNLNYAPFSFLNLSHFSSTTSQRSTTTAFLIIANSDSPIVEFAKATARNTVFAVRTFTVTGTTLT
jgi:hypothetical protein